MIDQTVIALVAPLPPIQGGIAQHAAAMGRALEERGARVHRISWRDQYPSWLYPGKQPRIPKGGPHIMRWWRPDTWIRARMLVGDADIIVFPWVTPFNAWILAAVIAGRRERCVAIVHNVEPHETLPLQRLLTRFALRRLGGYVTHSREVAAQLREVAGDVEIETVPHPPNLDLEPQPYPPSPPVRLLFLGHLRPYKGVDVLIDAVARLRQQGTDLRLTIAGEDWGIGTELLEHAERLELSGLITFRFEYIPDEEVRELLADHHIVVQPYRSATQSGVVPLALSAGRPVVVTSAGGLSEQVEASRTGEVAAPGDAESLASAIGRSFGLLEGPLTQVDTAWQTVATAILRGAGPTGTRSPH